MSQSGQLVFFTEIRPHSMTVALATILKWTGARNYIQAFDNNGKDVGGGASLNDLSRIADETAAFTIWVGSCSKVDFLASAIQQSINPLIRADFCPEEIYIFVGKHVLQEDAESCEGRMLGVLELGVSFWGYGCPNDTETMRHLLLKMSEVKMLEEELKTIMGEIETCIYWDV